MQHRTAIAATVTKLMAHYWLPDEPVALRKMVANDWLEDLEEFPPEVVELACREYRRGPTFRIRPLPGDIRALCVAELRDRAEHAAITDERARRWPKWLEETWGPEPDGPIRRAEAMARDAAAMAASDEQR